MGSTAGYCMLALLLGACAPNPRTPADGRSGQSPTRPPGSPEQVVLSRTIISPESATDIEQIVAEGSAKSRAGLHAEAAARFDRAVQLDPDGPLAPEALYQAALSREQAGDREGSLQRFEQLARRFPSHALGRDALVRSIRLLCFLERWQAAGAAADVLLTRFTDLNPFEAVAALSAKALARVADSDVDGASYHVEKGRTIIEDHRLDAAGAIPRDLAQLYFALGEVRRIRAERIRFDPLPANFPAVLEERCQLLLDAQSAYSDAMRAYDAHWSAMAGFRVGELYQKLHEDLMAVPKPKTADTDARRQLFEGAMRLRYGILIDKALAMMEHTLAMAKNTGERSAWVDKATDARQKLERARKAEDAAIDRLPYTRAQLQAALDDLAKKARDEEAKKKDKR